jgi:hypothetical protein
MGPSDLPSTKALMSKFMSHYFRHQPKYQTMMMAGLFWIILRQNYLMFNPKEKSSKKKEKSENTVGGSLTSVAGKQSRKPKVEVSIDRHVNIGGQVKYGWYCQSLESIMMPACER